MPNLLTKERRDAPPHHFVFAFPDPGPDGRVTRLQSVYYIEDADPGDILRLGFEVRGR